MTIRLGHRVRHNSASDILRYVKQNYVPPPATTPDRSIVTARTDIHYKSTPLADPRPNRYSRHDSNRMCGHFSIPWRPYQTLGEVCTGSYTLFCQVLGVEPPHEHNDYHVTLLDPDYRQREWSAGEHKGTQDCQNNKVRTPCEVEGKPVLFSRDQAGLTAIRGQLREMRGQKMALQAGQDYRDCIKMCDKRASDKGNETHPAGEMNIQSLSSHHFNVNRKYTLAYDPETMTMQVKTKAGAQAQTLANRKKQEFMQRLEALNIILTSVVNLKSRHLRTRNPLSQEVVQNLRKVTEGHTIGPRATTLERSSGTNHKLKSSHGPTSVISIDQDLSGRSLHAMGPLNIQSSTAKSQDNHLLRPSRRPHIYGRQSSVRKHEETPHRLDTWDDLVSDGKMKIRHRRPWFVNIDHRTSQHVKLRLHHPLDTKATKRTVMTMVRDQRMDMANLQTSVAKQTQDRISKHLRDRKLMHESKLEALHDLHPLWEEKRRQIAQITTNQLQQSQQDQGDLPQQTVEWFGKLRTEAEEINSSSHDTFLKLDKLKRFATEEFPHLTNVKEKLCLLTVSLPISEICTPTFHTAITFILSEIFGLPSDLLRQWLAYRHIQEA